MDESRPATPTRVPPGGGTTAPASYPTADVEAHLRRIEQQLTLLKAQVRQAQQLAGLGTNAMMVIHEVSNVLAPIRGYAEAALSTDDVELKNKALRRAVMNVEVAARMADLVLEIGAAKPTSLQPVRVRETIELACQSLCRDLSKDGITLVTEVADDVIVRADPLHLRQVFFNLFLNAREALSKSHSGRIKVSAAKRGDRMVIHVHDTGPGIPPDLLPYVFDPLQTSKPARRNGSLRCGGLGLALCRDLVEGCGGTIRVHSSAEEGTTFELILPTVDG